VVLGPTGGRAELPAHVQVPAGHEPVRAEAGEEAALPGVVRPHPLEGQGPQPGEPSRSWVGSRVQQLRSLCAGQVRFLTYRRAELMLSDHKPVAAQLQAKIRMIVKEKRQEVSAEINRMLDRWENDQHPKVQLEIPEGRQPNVLEFRDTRYGVDTRRSLHVTNISQASDSAYYMPYVTHADVWMAVHPVRITTMAGGRALPLRVEAGGGAPL
jgi:hypothetical protein